MHNNHPHGLTQAEWDRVAAVPAVRDAWGLTPDEQGDALASVAYAAKFTFVSGSPGYVGPLYVVHGDSFGGPPMVLTRDQDGRLSPVRYD